MMAEFFSRLLEALARSHSDTPLPHPEVVRDPASYRAAPAPETIPEPVAVSAPEPEIALPPTPAPIVEPKAEPKTETSPEPAPELAPELAPKLTFASTPALPSEDQTGRQHLLYEARIADLKELYGSQITDLKSVIVELADRHNGEIERLIKSHQAEVQRLVQLHNANLSNLHAQAERSVTLEAKSKAALIEIIIALNARK